LACFIVLIFVLVQEKGVSRQHRDRGMSCDIVQDENTAEDRSYGKNGAHILCSASFVALMRRVIRYSTHVPAKERYG
jgi:hypothetical protein